MDERANVSLIKVASVVILAVVTGVFPLVVGIVERANLSLIKIASVAVFAVIMGVGFPRVVGRGEARPITPGRTIAVALLTLGAVVSALLASLISDQLWDRPWYGNPDYYPIWRLLWAVIALAIAFGLHRFRSAWPSTGWTAGCLGAAELLMAAIAVGNVIAAVGFGIFGVRLNYFWSLIVQSGAELLAVGSLAILLLVCLVLLAVGVRGALRPTAQAS
jgi:hypothetical protein